MGNEALRKHQIFHNEIEAKILSGVASLLGEGVVLGPLGARMSTGAES